MNNLDNFFMETALEHSKKSLPDCKPNPPVGCVIVIDDKIIAKGFTQKPGQAHAEVNALEEIKDKTILEQATIYVTLEPCSFKGRTPSCAKTLSKLRPKEVVVGMIDPDSRNNGKGIKILNDAGIPTRVGILENKIRNFISPFLNKS